MDIKKFFSDSTKTTHQDQLTKFMSFALQITQKDRHNRYYWRDYNHFNETEKKSFRSDWLLEVIKLDNGGIDRVLLCNNIVVSGIIADCDGNEINVYHHSGLIKVSTDMTHEVIVEKLTVLFKELVEEQKKYSFCKITHNFEKPNFKALKELTASTFGYLNLGECCVCYDNTTTKTKCGHHLCYECWGALKKKECPMCRSDIKCAYCSCSDCDPDADEDINGLSYDE